MKESSKDLLFHNNLSFSNLILYSVVHYQLTFCILGQLAKNWCEIRFFFLKISNFKPEVQ